MDLKKGKSDRMEMMDILKKIVGIERSDTAKRRNRRRLGFQRIGDRDRWEKLAAYRKNELWSLMVESIDDFFLFKN